MFYNTYKKGHLFEQEVLNHLQVLFSPDILKSNLVFNNYPIYEMDLLCCINSKILIIECKDYSGSLKIDGSDNMTYNDYFITNFIKTLKRKVSCFNRLFNVRAYGLVVISSNAGLENIPNTIAIDEISKITNVLPNLRKSDISNLSTLMTPEYQLNLLMKRRFRE